MQAHGVNCSPVLTVPTSATYKVAARWSHGTFAELKTYGFACSDHVGEVFQEAENRRLDYTLRPGEVIEELAIYRFEPGKRDRQLQRLRGPEGVLGPDLAVDGEVSVSRRAARLAESDVDPGIRVVGSSGSLIFYRMKRRRGGPGRDCDETFLA